MTRAARTLPVHGGALGSLPHLDPRAAVAEVLSRFGIRLLAAAPAPDAARAHVPAIRRGLPGASVVGERLTMKSGEELLPGRGGVLRDVPLRRSLPSPFRGARGRAARPPCGRRRPLSRGEGPGDRTRLLRAHGVRPGEKTVFYDPVGRDVLIKYLLRVAQWQAGQLHRLSGTVILALDEPYLASVGSAIVALPREEVIAALDEIFDGLTGNPLRDPLLREHRLGLVLASKVGYLSFDAYEYADSLLLYPEEVSAFLARAACSPSV